MADANVPVVLRLPGGVSVCSSRLPDSSPHPPSRECLTAGGKTPAYRDVSPLRASRFAVKVY